MCRRGLHLADEDGGPAALVQADERPPIPPALEQDPEPIHVTVRSDRPASPYEIIPRAEGVLPFVPHCVTQPCEAYVRPAARCYIGCRGISSSAPFLLPRLAQSLTLYVKTRSSALRDTGIALRSLGGIGLAAFTGSSLCTLWSAIGDSLGRLGDPNPRPFQPSDPTRNAGI